ncbi:MAG: glutamate-cysteine ligase family protein [Myxococcales bacterium]|nr:glutamate-cysteine ligase family protein [Myxococcales bacterium]
MNQPAYEDAPIEREDQLLQPFEAAFKPPERFRVGTEAEKFGVIAGSGKPRALSFEGPDGVQEVLCRLADRFGWEPQREHARGEIIYLSRGEASITLEPAAQLELSGAPLTTIHETAREFAEHREELLSVSQDLGVSWVCLGFHPFATHDELPHVPKLRYAIMKRYMPTRGPRSVDMMRRTCTVQANLDYEDERDAMRKLRLALALQPIATTMFSNSPFIESRRSRYLSERAATWMQMDRDRSGLLPFAWRSDATLESYVQWALDVPMFMVKRGSRVLENTGQTFRSFLHDGFENVRATHEDWKTHLNSLFPEARLKGTLEVRGADGLPHDLVCAVPALWKGLLYDGEAFSAAEALVEPLSVASLEAARPAAITHGLRAPLLDRTLQRWAEQLLEIASAGLARQASAGPEGQPDETEYLLGITRLVSHGQTPAERLLEAVGEGATPSRVVRQASL